MNDNNKFYNIITYGCQMNEHDSEKLAGMLENMGYQATNSLDKADIILLNTCIIRENAELKVYGKLGSLKPLKEKKKDLIIGIGGCMMQHDEAVDEIYKKYQHVDLIFGTHNIHHLPDLIEEISKNRNRLVEVWDEEEGLIPDLPARRDGDYTAWVSIIQGCDNFCTYCIVPYVRGRERSRSISAIVTEVKKLVEDGVKEITLLGQNVNSYGKDLSEKENFAELLKELDKIENLFRIRFMTSHPRDFSLEIVDTISKSTKICEQFHLPVQSGSDKLLKAMNRGYTRSYYLKLIESIKEKMPEAAISTDFIVGFPGETEKDFQATLSLVKECSFDMAYTFIYSPRKGTPAARKEDQIKDNVKKERLERLMNLQNEISYLQNKKLIGTKQEIFITGESKNNSQRLEGRTRGNKLVFIDKTPDLIGRLVEVKILEAKSWTLDGKLSKIIK